MNTEINDRKCIDCNLVLPEESKDWVIRCVECYYKYKRQLTHKPCDECKELKIKKEMEYKKCYDCYISNNKI